MKKEKIIIKIKPDDSRLRNFMHFDVQRRTRASVFKPKKGKGSFRRRPKHKNKEI